MKTNRIVLFIAKALEGEICDLILQRRSGGNDRDHVNKHYFGPYTLQPKEVKV